MANGEAGERIGGQRVRRARDENRQEEVYRAGEGIAALRAALPGRMLPYRTFGVGDLQWNGPSPPQCKPYARWWAGLPQRLLVEARVRTAPAAMARANEPACSDEPAIRATKQVAQREPPGDGTRLPRHHGTTLPGRVPGREGGRVPGREGVWGLGLRPLSRTREGGI